MKKIKKVLYLTLLFIGILLLTGCNKEPISANDFYINMKKKDFTLTNVTEDYSSYNNIEKVYSAQDPSLSYQIVFFETKDDSSAKEVFKSIKKVFKTSLSRDVKHKVDKDINDNSKYTAVSGIRFMYINRKKNTIVYVKTKSEFRREILNILKKIGY